MARRRGGSKPREPRPLPKCVNCNQRCERPVKGYCERCLPDIAERWSEQVSARTARSTIGRYGMTVEQHGRLFAQQDGLCAICRDPLRSRKTGAHGSGLVIDHHHGSGQVRALLCSRCNAAIGLMNENSDWLRRAARYVDKSFETDRLEKTLEDIRARIAAMEESAGGRAPEHMYEQAAAVMRKIENIESLPTVRRSNQRRL